MRDPEKIALRIKIIKILLFKIRGVAVKANKAIIKQINKRLFKNK